jgi:cytochrome b561
LIGAERSPAAPQGWSLSIRIMHWVMAILVLATAVLGLAMVNAAMPIGARFTLFQWHKSLGLCVLGLIGLRIILRLSMARPPLPGSGLTRCLAAVTQLLLILLLVAAPVTGLFHASASTLGVPTRFFGLFTLPPLIAPHAALAERLQLAHRLLTYAILALSALHIGAALKHHFIDRDNVLRRMIRAA